MAERSGGIQIKWETIIMTIGLVVVMVGGFWTIAYIPIDNNQKRLENQIAEVRQMATDHMRNDDSKYLTKQEHEEFKHNVRDADTNAKADLTILRAHIEDLRKEAATRADVQQALNTTRVEFLSEIKRLDQGVADHMSRKEFSIWKSERDKLIASIQERQNRFSEALDSIYSKITLQPPSYQQKQ